MMVGGRRLSVTPWYLEEDDYHDPDQATKKNRKLQKRAGYSLKNCPPFRFGFVQITAYPVPGSFVVL